MQLLIHRCCCACDLPESMISTDLYLKIFLVFSTITVLIKMVGYLKTY